MGKINIVSGNPKQGAGRGFVRKLIELRKTSESKVFFVIPKTKLGFFKKSDDAFTMNESETFKVILETHFLSCILDLLDNDSFIHNFRFRSCAQSKTIARSIVDINKLKWSLKYFGPYKAPGPYGVIPVLLQQNSELVLHKIVVTMLHSHQHAYQRGKSTSKALHQLVFKIDAN
ncbi:MAG: hypothetical protein ACRY3E_02205 [Candidatus Lariskella arthropodorum]